MILKSVARILSPGGDAARLSILIFHRVLSRPDGLMPGEPDIRRFDAMVGWLSAWFNIVPLDRAVAQLQHGALPPRAAAITFDDGYADNAHNALPVLQRHGVCATFFVSTAFLDGGRMWNDSIIECVRQCPPGLLDLRPAGLGIYPTTTLAQRRQAIDQLLNQVKYLEPAQRDTVVQRITGLAGVRQPDGLMMRKEQVLGLRNAGMQIGAHTCSHPILQRTDDHHARAEIVDGKARLETLLGEPVTLFAYPNGKPGVDYSSRHVAMVRAAGFAAAVSTTPGVATPRVDAFQLPRFTPWDRSRLRFGLRMLANLRMCVPAG